MYHKIPCGPTVAFDVDDTLLMWDIPDELPADYKIIKVVCRGETQHRLVNHHNLGLLIKMAKSGHAIIVWSAGGSDWAEAAVKALGICDLVDTVSGKLTYYIDDLSDPAKVLGKHGYFDMNGKRADTDHYAHKQDSFDD